MQTSIDDIKASIAIFYRYLFEGRISRTSFLIRLAVIVSALWLVGKPLTTILATSSKTVHDFYLVISLAFFAVCLLGYASAYVKRLHDFGLAGWWALIFNVAVPVLVATAAQAYGSYRYEQDRTASLTEFNDVISVLFYAFPLAIALWKGEVGENKFGLPPQPVEQLLSNKFSKFAFFGAAAILIPTSIYVGLFQSGVWVGRGSRLEAPPLMNSNVAGDRFMSCWNLKGVGAGSGEGEGSGIYRDGYSGNVFNFIITPTGQIDIAMAGERSGATYLADGFRIIPYGLEEATNESGYIDTQKVDKFMLVAVFDQGDKDAAINYTTFTFGRNKSGWPQFNVVMTSAISTSPSAMKLVEFPAAKGRLMVGDCVPY